jgi:hypothetical protein
VPDGVQAEAGLWCLEALDGEVGDGVAFGRGQARARVRDLTTGVHSLLVTADSAQTRQTAGSVAVARTQMASRGSMAPTVVPDSMRVFGLSRTPYNWPGEMSWSASQYR